MKASLDEKTPVWQSRDNPDFTIAETPLLIPEIYGEKGVFQDYAPEEISADDLFRMWVGMVRSRPEHKSGFVDIWWSVCFSDQVELAPFMGHLCECPTIYDYWHQCGGEPFNWMTCPVADTKWNNHRRKTRYTGFIQEVTGWKPSPLQSSVYLPALIHAAESKSGMPVREYSQRREYAVPETQDA